MVEIFFACDKMKMLRITPFVTQLNTNEIFVFGSNEAGRHGRGAAKLAKKWGAISGVGEGLQGNTYGIPTKNTKIQTLSKEKISNHVQRFITFAKERPELIFLVTEIGCGLAKYTAKDIAPLFYDCQGMENVYLPLSFWNIISNPSVK